MGVCPRGAQVRQRCGRWLSPLSSMKTRIRPSWSAFFLVLATPSSSTGGSALRCVPVLVPPVAADSSPDQPESSRHGPRDSERQTPARSSGPHGDRSTAESHSLAARDLRPVASLTAAAVSHSSAASGRRVPLSGARTCPGHDTRAPNEPRTAEQRGVGEQSRIDSVRAPTSEWLESVVSLRLQNRDVLPQGFPYPVRRSIPEKVSLYYAGFNNCAKLHLSLLLQQCKIHVRLISDVQDHLRIKGSLRP